MVLLIVGTGATSILSTPHAQSAKLGEPYFVEKGMVTTQIEIALIEHNPLLLPME
jgi:hypothetical protein